MHRQSLGSPSPKEETLITDIDDAPKPKPHRLSPPPPPPHKFIHLIPLLTLLCFFVLYLCSHTPSPSGTTTTAAYIYLLLLHPSISHNHFLLSDINHFAGLNRTPSHRLAAEEVAGDIGSYMDVKRSDVLAIRSLQQISKSSPHRKLADF
ncbi:hypothetical protein Fmac_002912 [Flemingia macrophylla]|uniref:Uncharacterized protein n=1 Tax=Flemingia macrophylla TaxID=520843 RepID=A0ABD1NL96_9FABA